MKKVNATTETIETVEASTKKLTSKERLLRWVKKHGRKGAGRTEAIRFLEGQTLSLQKRMKANCYLCMGCFADGREQCSSPTCPFYDVMPYRNAQRSEGGTTFSSAVVKTRLSTEEKAELVATYRKAIMKLLRTERSITKKKVQTLIEDTNNSAWHDAVNALIDRGYIEKVGERALSRCVLTQTGAEKLNIRYRPYKEGE